MDVPYVPGPASTPPPNYTTPTPPPRKRMAAWKVVTITLSAIAVLCGLGAVGIGVLVSSVDAPSVATRSGDPLPAVDDKPAPNKASTFKVPVGTTITADDGEGVVHVTVTASRWQVRGCDNNALSKPKMAYVVIDVTVQVVSGTGSVNPLYFEFTATDGTDATMGIFAGCADLGSGNGYPAGTTKKGQLVYDAARGPGELYWSTWTEQIGSWLIPD
jgi:hypothetical protein